MIEVPPVADRRPYKFKLGKVENEKRGDDESLLIDPYILHDDDLYWLRDDTRTNDEILSLLRRENEYYNYKTAHLKESSDRLYNEIKSRIQESDNSVPYKKGSYYYYNKTEEGKSYSLHCRALYNPITKSLEEEEVYLDENEIANDHEMCDVHHVVVADNTSLVAYAVDFSGTEEYEILFKDIKTGDILSDKITNTAGVIVWNKDSNTIFYTTLDDQHRPSRVFMHVLGTDISQDYCIFEELDDKSWVHITRTSSDEYLVIRSTTKLTTSILMHPLSERAIQAAEKNDSMILSSPLHLKRKPDDIDDTTSSDAERSREIPVIRLLNLPKVESVLYEVDHYRNDDSDGDKDVLIILTNISDAKNFKLCWCFITKPVVSEWRDLVPSSDHVYITDIEVHSSYIAISGSEDGYQNVWIALIEDLQRVISGSAPTLVTHRLPPRDEVYVLALGSNEEYETNALRFTYCSPTCPDLVCELVLHNSVSLFNIGVEYGQSTVGSVGDIVVLKQRQVPNVDLREYKTTRLMAPTRDGKHVPISILYRPSALKSKDSSSGLNCSPFEPAPILLYAYGAYGISWDPEFSCANLSLCDRGVIYCISHVRGGSELGRQWYLDGKLLNKKNSFFDYIDSADYLIKSGWTTCGCILSAGGSAGGLLVTVAVNERPDLFAAVSAGVPFVDAIVTMADDTIPLVSTEWHEWGNPNEYKYYEYMKTYSPIDNIKSQRYPPILLSCGLNDYRVQYWEVLKYSQRCRQYNTNYLETIMKCELDEGHTGAMDRYRHIRDIAEEYAYLLDKVNIIV